MKNQAVILYLVVVLKPVKLKHWLNNNYCKNSKEYLAQYHSRRKIPWDIFPHLPVIYTLAYNP